MRLRPIGAAVIACALALSISAAEARQKQTRHATAAASHCVYENSGRVTCPAGEARMSGHAKAKVRRMTAPVSLAFAGDLVVRARAHLGKTAADLGLPRRLWCADFMNLLLNGGTGSRQARSYLNYGPRLSGPQVGAIAVLRRGKGGGHVGVVSGIDPNGNPIIVSGNHNRRVGEAAYPRSRVIAYVSAS